MTSLWRHLWLTYQTYRVSLLSGCVKLMAWRVLKIWWWSVRNFGRYRRRTTGGRQKIAPPPSRRGSTRHPFGYFRTHDRLGQVSDPTPLLSREPIVVSSPTRRRSKTLHKISPLTRNWPGGGGLFFAPSRFSAISPEVTYGSSPNFQYSPNHQFYTSWRKEKLLALIRRP